MSQMYKIKLWSSKIDACNKISFKDNYYPKCSGKQCNKTSFLDNYCLKCGKIQL